MEEIVQKFEDEVNVTGLTIYSYSKRYKELKVGDTVVLKRDLANKYDVNATGVFLELPQGLEQLGWIPKAKNSEFAKNISKNEVVYAKITKHDTGSSDLSGKLFIKVIPNTMQDMFTYRNNVPISNAEAYNTLKDTVIKDTIKQYEKEYEAQFIQQPTKEKQMTNFTDKVINVNTATATDAAFLEAGRIANNQAVKFASKTLPLMVRGYADTPVGKLTLANAAVLAAAQFRPNDKRLTKLTQAMLVVAWQELYQSFDIEEMIDSMLDNKSIKKALDKLDIPNE